MREKENFRYEMERLDETFPNKNILSVIEVANYLGVSRQSVSRHIKRTSLGISKSTLADYLAGGMLL